MQYTVDAVRSGIVLYDGGDIVFDTKKVKPVDAVHSGCSGIVVYGGGDIVFGAKKVKPMDAVDTICSGCSRIVVYGGEDIVFDTKRSNKWTQCMQYAVCSSQWMQWNSGIW